MPLEGSSPAEVRCTPYSVLTERILWAQKRNCDVHFVSRTLKFLAEQLHQRGVRWQFNPPLASHMGGVRERLIRSAKKIFNALLLQQRVTDECLFTLVTEAEYILNILNSRPLIPIVLDPEAQEPLTPNHLLLCGHEWPSLPPGLFLKSDCYSHYRWKQVQYLAEQFWRRWTREYIQTVQP